MAMDVGDDGEVKAAAVSGVGFSLNRLVHSQGLERESRVREISKFDGDFSSAV
jgi:hypothetical protein